MYDLIEYASYLNFSLIVIAIILNVCCLKWRNIAKCFFHIEMLAWTTRALIPETNC